MPELITGPDITARDRARAIVDAIDTFDAHCEEHCYTDTDYVWELLRNIRETAEPLTRPPYEWIEYETTAQGWLPEDGSAPPEVTVFVEARDYGPEHEPEFEILLTDVDGEEPDVHPDEIDAIRQNAIERLCRTSRATEVINA